MRDNLKVALHGMCVLLFPAIALAASVSGNAFLEGQVDHAGISIQFWGLGVLALVR